MTVSRQLRASLESRLAECLAGEFLDERLRQIAEEKQAFVVYCDIGGAAMLDLEGHVWVFPWDDEDASEDSAKGRLLTLVIAAERFPELQELLPIRPVSALDCPSCHGTGSFAHLSNLKCLDCAGLGWIA